MDQDIFKKAFANKSCLVTGGTGLIGRAVAKALRKWGALVRVASLDDIKLCEDIEAIRGDLTDFSFCKQCVQGMDFVFHVAGIKGSIEVTKSKPASFFVPLLQMNTNLLEAARREGVDKLVYTSSIGAYSTAEVFIEPEDPLADFDSSPMDSFPGWAKRMAEMQIAAYNIQYGMNNYTIVRPCNVYGPGDNFDPENAMVIPSLMARIANGERPLTVWGDGSAIRDFAYSEDVAYGIAQALLLGAGKGIFNLGSGIGYTIRELVETLASIAKIDFQFDTSKPSGYPRRIMDISKASQELGYTPKTTLAEGLKSTWEWYLENPGESAKRKNYFTENEHGED